MKKSDYASFYENEPKYAGGDIIVVNGKLHIISSVAKELLTDDQKNDVCAYVARRKVCCGQGGRAVRMGLNYFYYKCTDENLFNEIEITGSGIDAANALICDLQEENDRYSEQISAVLSAVGFDHERY